MKSCHKYYYVGEFVRKSPLYFWLAIYGKVKCYHGVGLTHRGTYLLGMFQHWVHGRKSLDHSSIIGQSVLASQDREWG